MLLASAQHSCSYVYETDEIGISLYKKLSMARPLRFGSLAHYIGARSPKSDSGMACNVSPNATSMATKYNQLPQSLCCGLSFV